MKRQVKWAVLALCLVPVAASAGKKPKGGRIGQLQGECTGGDETACLALGEAYARGSYTVANPTSALAVLGPSCARGASDSCLFGLVVARNEGSDKERELQALLTGACLTGSRFACHEAADMLRVSNPDLAKKAWDIACKQGDDRGCGMRDGSWPATLDTTAPPAAFLDAVRRAGMAYKPLAGFSVVEAPVNEKWAYQHAIKADGARLEVRFQVEPLDTLFEEQRACAARANCTPVDPNTVYEHRYEFACAGISSGHMALGDELTELTAKARYNANWAATRAVEVSADFAPYKSAQVLAMHRDDAGDATVVVLYDDPADVEAWLEAAVDTLAFATPPAP